MNKFTANTSQCVRCGACAKDCPSRIIQQQNGGTPFVADEAHAGCLHCQHCLAVCPRGAASVEGCAAKESLPLSGVGILPTEEQLRRLVRGRRTTRQYLAQDADPALVARLLDDLAYTPTGCNARKLGIRVIDSREVMDRFRARMLDECRKKAGEKQNLFPLGSQAVSEWEQGRDLILRGAPHALAVFAPQDTPCPQEDVSLALAYFELLANSAGLGTTWCGLLKWVMESLPSLKESFGIPVGAHYYTMLFGVPDVRFARTVQRAWPNGAVARATV